MAGKGSRQRPTNLGKYSKEYKRIFSKEGDRKSEESKSKKSKQVNKQLNKRGSYEISIE